MKLQSIAALAALGIALSGCASIVEGTTQMVQVATPPVDGAACTLSSSQGVYTVTTPGSVKVHKTKDDMKVVCKKDGYQDGTTVVLSHFNGATAGNLLLGGVVGMAVDASTGANYNFPDAVSVPMQPMAPAAAATPAATAAPADGAKTSS
ncbi:MAG TPA: hypothetical protein VHZ78_06125 [Rhizomicrobium sp.]|jgi:phosphoketolase|nr:hypothetical protein [Rhizomicrobium sp.]